MTIERNEHLRAIGKVTGPVVVLVGFLGFALWYMDRISGLAALGVVLGGPVLGVALGFAISKGTTLAGRSLAEAVTAAHDLTPAPSFSYQESLVARGEPELARDAYESYLAEHPDDLDAWMALAALWRDGLGDPAKAIESYLEVRRRKPSRRQEYAIGNALIDLFHQTGQSGREMAELARLADRFGDTEAGVRAREAIRRLKRGA